MTQDEAITRAVNINKARELVFCPFIRENCKANCDWYDSARPHKPASFEGSDAWTVLGGYCEPKVKNDCNC